MLARRVSEEMNVELGTTVGYSVRFTEASDPLQTRIKFLTDGTLIRECMSDPLLSCYSVIMIDEAQDRSIATDTLLALLKKIIAKRKDDFRVVISSASLDAEQFRKYFDDSVIVSISGQMFPVDIHYLQTPCENYLIAAIETVISIHKQELPGDILVFLPGKDDILAAISEIKEHLLANRRLESLLALPMYSGLSPKDQKPVFDAAPAGMRKVVFATNVAETSVTIDGVLYVVDCGFVKQRVFDLATGLDKLVTLPISKSSAKQRAGRAGRTQPGKVYRLYTQAAFNSALFPQHDVPEICRLPLPSMMLMLLALGVTNLVQFDYFQHPPPELLSHSLEELASLGAVDITNGLLTPNLGLHVAELPLDPKLGVCLLNGVQKFACAREAIAAVAMLSLGESPFTAFSGKPRDRDNSVEEWREFTVQEGDVLSYVNALLGYQDTPAKARPQWCRLYSLDIRLLEQASRISRQLKGFVNRMGFQSSTTCGRNFELLQKCIFSGFFANAAKLDRASGQYQIIRSKTTADVHPTSIYFSQDSRPDYIIYTSAMETTKLFIRDLMSIEPEWLTEQASHYYYSVQ
ncbi:hypothetical protein IWW36_000701 [Coemansia brasiliensis]|uniref:RNA helicase n=1 Tax=Coemansia brasiliensis TaxID=2650707 RepID=A0A9W8IAK2_9FUNG|nr:hypothetical protein IWW36_000701 [Coemansia brasiliensis]